MVFAQSSPGRVVATLFSQPSLGAGDVAERIIGEVHPAGERFYIRLGNHGKDGAAAALDWNVGRQTGLHLSPGESPKAHQRGPRVDGEGTAVQLRGREIGIWIDSDRPRPRLGALIPVCPAYWWWNVEAAPRPFREPNREISFSFDMKAPTARREGKAEVYVCAHFLWRDARSGRHFWLGASVFDLRPESRFPDIVHSDDWENGTHLPILFSALNRRSAWMHPGPGSAMFTDRTFDEYRRFDYRVGADELRAAVSAMRRRAGKYADVSESPGDYQLVHFNLNPEVYAPEGSRGQLGVALRDIRVELIER